MAMVQTVTGNTAIGLNGVWTDPSFMPPQNVATT
jgi:hypothetical protein